MIGDLSVRPAPALEPGPTARPGPERVAASPEADRRAAPVQAGAATATEDGTAGTAATRLRSMLADPDLRVQTQHDPGSGRTVMQFQDRATGEVVEQLPSETLLKLYAAIREPLIDQQA